MAGMAPFNWEDPFLLDVQLTDEERRSYLAESIFLNQVKYENDKLESYLRKLGKSAQG